MLCGMTCVLAPLVFVVAAASGPQRIGPEVDTRSAGASVLVRVFDASGAAWTEAPCFGPLDLGRPLGAEWPATVRVLAFERDDLGDRGWAAGEPLPSLWLHRSSDPFSMQAGRDAFARNALLGPGETELDVVPGARYLVGAMGPGFDGSLREVEVPRAGGRVVVDLHARDLGELGTVAVRVRHRNREIGGRGWPLDVTLRSIEGDACLLALDTNASAPPLVLHAPAGAYRIAVEGRADVNWHGVVWHPREAGRAEREIELAPGQTTDVELDIGDGARLEVSVDGAPTEADRLAVWGGRFVPYVASGDVAAREAATERLAGQAQLYLVSDDRRREPVLFLEEAWAGTSAAGLHLNDRWLLGTTHLSECLPAGRYTLVARLPGGREARAEVELLEGSTTPVFLRL
jgi:hypothetical protein